LTADGAEAIARYASDTELNSDTVGLNHLSDRVSALTRQKIREIDPRTLNAAHFVMVFTTIPAPLLGAGMVLELYRFRWQIELAFKLLKQLLKLGCLPHKAPDPRTNVNTREAGGGAPARDPVSKRAGFFPPGGTASKRCSGLRRELRPSLWRWTAVFIAALRQALCPSPGLLALIQATACGKLRHALDDGLPGARRVTNSPSRSLEALNLRLTLMGTFPFALPC